MMNVCVSVYVSLKLQRNLDNNLKVTWQCKDEANVYNILVQWLVSGATQCRKDHQEELGYWYPHQVELAVSIMQPEKKHKHKSVAYNLSVIGINQQQQKWEKFGVNSVNLPRMWKEECGKVWSSTNQPAKNVEKFGALEEVWSEEHMTYCWGSNTTQGCVECQFPYRYAHSLQKMDLDSRS